jgi:hypothetical protein
VAIEFHCNHCNHQIRAPNDVGGQQGKCPHCGGTNYIPHAPEEIEELSLAPLDDDEEQRRRQAVLEDAAYQQRLLREQAAPGEGGRGKPLPPTTRQITSMIVHFVEAMSASKLEEADKLARQLERNSQTTRRILDELAGEDLSAYGLPSLPRPILLGFLKELRSKL